MGRENVSTPLARHSAAYLVIVEHEKRGWVRLRCPSLQASSRSVGDARDGGRGRGRGRETHTLSLSEVPAIQNAKGDSRDGARRERVAARKKRKRVADELSHHKSTPPAASPLHSPARGYIHHSRCHAQSIICTFKSCGESIRFSHYFLGCLSTLSTS